MPRTANTGDLVLVRGSPGCAQCRFCTAGFTARCERAESGAELCHGVRTILLDPAG